MTGSFQMYKYYVLLRGFLKGRDVCFIVIYKSASKIVCSIGMVLNGPTIQCRAFSLNIYK